MKHTHPVKVSYLVVGLVFLSITGLWLLREQGLVDVGATRWFLPVALVVAGGVGLAATAFGRRGPEDPDPALPYDEPTATYAEDPGLASSEASWDALFEEPAQTTTTTDTRPTTDPKEDER